MQNKRKQYLSEFLQCMDEAWLETLYVNGYTIGIDFRVIRIESLHKYPVPILLLTGWGSGYEGILPLAFSLACEGFEVILISLPGYGNSENPTPWFYKDDIYFHFAKVVLQVLKKIGIQGTYFVGHSMGAEILAEAAFLQPHTCEKLILLHPSGLWPVVGSRAKAALFYRFATSGIQLRREYHNSDESHDDYLKPLIDLCSQQKSPWWGRLRQRWAEFREVCKGELPKTLIYVSLPIVFISGGRDTVYDAEESLKVIKSIVPSLYLEWEIIPENMHNPTLFWPEKTASVIAKHLS